MRNLAVWVDRDLCAGRSTDAEWKTAGNCAEWRRVFQRCAVRAAARRRSPSQAAAACETVVGNSKSRCVLRRLHATQRHFAWTLGRAVHVASRERHSATTGAARYLQSTRAGLRADTPQLSSREHRFL